jgi:hypothetical protein
MCGEQKRQLLRSVARNVALTSWRGVKIRSIAAASAEKSSISLRLNAAANSTLQDMNFKRGYFALLAFLAQASLQYFFFVSNVMYTFPQTGHFLSKHSSSLTDSAGVHKTFIPNDKTAVTPGKLP